jgi:cysteine-rich repeat protein
MRACFVGLVAALGMGTLGGCGLTLDLEPDPDGGTDSDLGVLPTEDLGVDPVDGGPLRSCEGAEDGAPCGGTSASPFICIDERCVAARCGDGYLTGAEECDDGNTEDGDGCQATCLPGCVVGEDDACASSECSVGTCDLGSCISQPLADGTECSTGVCRAGVCASPLCGNGDVDGDEACDDGNSVDGDGCDSDCKLSCATDDDCRDGILCNGAESCVATPDGSGRICESAEVLPEAPRDCDYCDERTGDWELVDEDGDGYSPIEGDDCGPADCNDANASIYPGAPETTSGVDSDCDGNIPPEVTRLCYYDGDEDGFGDPDETTTITGVGDSCPSDFVPAGPPDCDDDNEDVNPGQLMYFQRDYCDMSGGDCSWDYNCDGRAERKIVERASCLGTSRTECEAGRSGWAGLRVPACGESAAFGECQWTGIACIVGLLPSSLVQSCR